VRHWIRQLNAAQIAGLARSALTMDDADEVESATRALAMELQSDGAGTPATSAQPERWIFDFADGSMEMRDPARRQGRERGRDDSGSRPERVPPGFTITTAACVEYMRTGRDPDGLAAQLAEALERLQRTAGKRLGDRADPLLVSVRSGARESMPGMLDTVLKPWP